MPSLPLADYQFHAADDGASGHRHSGDRLVRRVGEVAHLYVRMHLVARQCDVNVPQRIRRALRARQRADPGAQYKIGARGDLVPAVLPGFILLAVWAPSWLVGHLRQRGFDRVTCGGLGAVCAAALVLPAAITTYGLGIARGGPLGIKPTTVSVAFTTTYSGEITAISGMCAAIPRNASVVIVDGPIADHLAEVVRGMCDVPVARLSRVRLPAVQQGVRGIRQAGRRPVLLAAARSQLTPYGGPTRQVMALRSRQDEHTLTTPPRATWKLTFSVWMSEPSR